MGTWMNNDGLFVKFGRDKGKTKNAGEYEDADVGSDHVVDVIIDYADLDSTNLTFISDNLRIPKDCYLKKAELFVITAFTSGGSSTLDIGLYDTDRSTAVDADGIDAAIAKASLTLGATITCDGALINTRLANNTPCLIGVQAGTAAFTAGKARLRLWYYP